MPTLFNPPVKPTDPTFIALQRSPDACLRNYVDGLWAVFQPHADANFATEITTAFGSRYWEMYLATTMLDQGFAVQASPGGGPDLRVERDSVMVWVEAIAPGPGAGKDAVPQPQFNGVADRVPNEQVILRLCNSISEKFTKLAKYCQNNIVRGGDPYVVAINGSGVPYWQMELNVPRVLSAVLPIGDQYVVIERGSLKAVGGGFSYRDSISKASGNRVDTTYFQNPAYAEISAVLYSTANIWGGPWKTGSISYLVHNPLAKNPLPPGWLKLGSEFWVENDQVQRKDW